VRQEAAVLAVLQRARELGFLGPAAPEEQLTHALGFVEVAAGALGRPPSTFADLGTGGGVPGLVLGASWPDARGALIEASARRCAALRRALEELDLGGRVEVVEDRAEDVARRAETRECRQLVTSRGFGPPAVTAEIATGVVAVGGIVVVSEPPEPSAGRWPAEQLAELGFSAAHLVARPSGHFAWFAKERPARDGVPRRSGRPGKRPLW